MFVLLSALGWGLSSQLPPAADRRLVADAQAIVRSDGERVWAGISQAPFQFW